MEACTATTARMATPTAISMGERLLTALKSLPTVTPPRLATGLDMKGRPPTRGVRYWNSPVPGTPSSQRPRPSVDILRKSSTGAGHQIFRKSQRWRWKGQGWPCTDSAATVLLVRLWGTMVRCGAWPRPDGEGVPHPLTPSPREMLLHHTFGPGHHGARVSLPPVACQGSKIPVILREGSYPRTWWGWGHLPSRFFAFGSE